MCARELAFVDLTQRQLASGDIDALVRVSDLGDGEMLIENAPDHGETRLYYALRRGWCAAITWLLEQGADVNVRRPGGVWTPLHCAALEDHCDAAVLLLDVDARVDDRNRYGETALHCAAYHGHTNMCKLLVSRGASLDARDINGDDPEASARVQGRTAEADFLAAVRAAGGWQPYVDSPRKELLALRQRLPALRDRGRAAPSSSVRAHERLFLKTPEDVFSHVLAFWRSDRDD